MSLSRPSLYFNFANTPGFLDSRINFVRNSIGTFVQGNGLIITAPANTPRWSFDPITGECLGILVEPPKTNGFLYSEEFDHASWESDGTMGVVANAAMAPNGLIVADRLTAIDDGSYVIQSPNHPSSGNNLFISVFAKADSSNFLLIRFKEIYAWFDLNNKQTGSSYTDPIEDVFSFGSSGIEVYPDGWCRCHVNIQSLSTFSGTFPAGFSPVDTDLSYGFTGNSCFLWGAQMEKAFNSNPDNYMSSYIPTTSTMVTRAADNMSLPVDPTTDKWFNLGAGSIYFEWIPLVENQPDTVSYGGVANSPSDFIYLNKTQQSDGSANLLLIASFSGQLALSKPFPPSSLLNQKAMISWGDFNIKLALNGQQVVDGPTNLSAPSAAQRITIGFDPRLASATTRVAHAYMKAFAYYPKKLNPIEMMVITS